MFLKLYSTSDKEAFEKALEKIGEDVFSVSVVSLDGNWYPTFYITYWTS